MAPIRHCTPCTDTPLPTEAPTAPIMTLLNPAFRSVRIGNERTGIQVQLLAFPGTDSPLLDKVQAFAYLEEILRQHRPQLTSHAIQQAYADNVPVSSSASAAEEANRVNSGLLASFFHVANLTCLGFFKSDGTEASVALEPCNRDADISFVKFSSTIAPSTFSDALDGTPSSTVVYFLKLPQSIPPASSSTVPGSAPGTPADTAPNSPLTDTPPPKTAETAAVSVLRKMFASGGNPSQLDLSSPLMLKALTSIVNTSTDRQPTGDVFTPLRRNLFPGDAAHQSASPSVRRYLTNAASATLPSYCGPLDFLDSQAHFDNVFPSSDRQPIYSLRTSRAYMSSTAEPDGVETAIQACLSECRMLVFKSVIRLDYLGHHNFSSADHLQLTVQRIRLLRLKSNDRGVSTNGNPDTLFDKYLALIPLLPATHVNIWGINLFSQFWATLGDELTRRIMQLPRYIAIASTTFDLTTMATKDRQMNALRELRSLAVESWNATQDDKRSMRAMFQELSSNSTRNNNRSNSHHLDSSSHVSSAEATMARYSPSETSPSPAIQTNYQHPASSAPDGPPSDYPPDFRGCLGCGGADHVFRSCPMRRDPATLERFHRNFNIKFNRPQREQPPRRDSPYAGHAPRPPGSPPAFDRSATPSAGRGSDRNRPAWMTQQLHSRTDGPPAATRDSDPSQSPPKRPRNYTLFVRSCQHQVSTRPALRPMPLRVDNGLPHVRLELGPSSDATLSVLFDSGAALSSGYLPYHLWIMRENPEIVASFERFDDSNPFEPIKLGGAIRHPDDYSESMHGQLTAIIRYKTPYLAHDGSPIHISFGLGNDMTVNTILGMPVIKDLGMVPNFRTRSVVCDDSPATFDIAYHETCCGFPPDDATATTFSTLPVEDMYPRILSGTPSPPEPSVDDCVEASDDLTNGYLQRTLN